MAYFIYVIYVQFGEQTFRAIVKETRSVTVMMFRKKNHFKSFVKIELSYVFTINMFSTAENSMEKGIIL